MSTARRVKVKIKGSGSVRHPGGKAKATGSPTRAADGPREVDFDPTLYEALRSLPKTPNVPVAADDDL